MHVVAYQRLHHLVVPFSVQQMAPAHWETQQAVVIQHPRQFLLPLAKISGNYHKEYDVMFKNLPHVSSR